MGKSTKTYEERIQEKDFRIEKLAQELKRYEAQKKQLEKRRKEEERKIRTHRLIEIGAAVESVLGRCIELEEIPKLIAFLNKQEANGKFFSKAMQKSPDTDMKKEEVGESGVSCFPSLFREKGALIDRQSLSLARALRGLWEASEFQKINFRDGLLPI